MGTPREPAPVKYLIGLLSAERGLLDQVESDLAPAFGSIDSRTETLAWTESRFYEREMGAGLLRRFVSFNRLQPPGKLAELKLHTQKIEAQYRREADVGRRINIDPGYLDAFKLALASTKNAGQRIYLSGGIYAEATLMYHDGDWHGQPYTYHDYLWPETRRFLNSLRAVYLAQLRQMRA
jgi:hypothetical protein